MTLEASIDGMLVEADHTVVSHKDWPLIDITAADQARVSALFAEVFGTEMTPQFWDWKYGGGRGEGVGIVHPDGRLVAHYGVARREMQWAGKLVLAVHAGDVMVSPTVRHVFSRWGPFARLTDGIIKKCFGLAGFAVFGFGFPNARHIRLGSKLGFYWQLESVSELMWHQSVVPATESAVYAPWGVADTEARLQALFDRVAPVAGDVMQPRRSLDWWRHRFANHPHHRYQLHFIAQGTNGEDACAFVLKEAPARSHWELMDWVASANSSPGAADTIVGMATQVAQAQGATSLMLWASSAVLKALSPQTVQAASMQHACEVASAQALVLDEPAEHWQGKVWLTGADTDFR